MCCIAKRSAALRNFARIDRKFYKEFARMNFNQCAALVVAGHKVRSKLLPFYVENDYHPLAIETANTPSIRPAMCGTWDRRPRSGGFATRDGGASVAAVPLPSTPVVVLDDTDVLVTAHSCRQRYQAPGGNGSADGSYISGRSAICWRYEP